MGLGIAVGRVEGREQAGVKSRPVQQNNDTNCPSNQPEGLEHRLYCKGLALTKVFGYICEPGAGSSDRYLT